MAEVHVVLEAHLLDIRTGIWCDDCSLPSIVEADIAIVSPKTLHIIDSSTYRVCSNEAD